MNKSKQKTIILFFIFAMIAFIVNDLSACDWDQQGDYVEETPPTTIDMMAQSALNNPIEYERLSLECAKITKHRIDTSNRGAYLPDQLCLRLGL